MQTTMKITILGNGDSLGTPRVYCDCEVCAEARTTRANVRLRSSLWIECNGEQPLLLDCGPDWRTQMERLGVRQVRHGIVTHAHFDHIGGLVDWADGCRWLDEKAHLYGPSEVLDEIGARFPWLGGRLKLTPNDEGMFYGPWRVVPWKVNHGKNGFSYAYRFEHKANLTAWAYCSDAINLTETQKAPLQGVELLVLGTSFFEEPYAMDTRSVYDVKEGLQLVHELGVPRAIFTHLSHDIDIRQAYPLPDHIRFAFEGMVIRI